MITVNVNQQPQHLPKGHSLQELLSDLAITQTGIAVAINQQVIPRSQWDNTLLEEGHQVLIIKAAQGG